MKDGMDRAAWIVGFALLALVAAPAGAADCNQAGNELSNCDFTNHVGDWTLVTGDMLIHEPADGATAPGCLEVSGYFNNTTYDVWVVSDCLPVTGGGTYQSGFSVKRQTGQAGVECFAQVTYYTGVTCSSFLSNEVTPGIVIDSIWQEIFETHVAPATAESAAFLMICGHSSDYEVRFDDALYGQGLVPAELISFMVE